MSTSTTPRRPVEDWERVRDEWVAELERFMDDAETWAKRQGWGTLRETRTIDEPPLGKYPAPRLLIHDLFGRVLLDPTARFVVGAEGRVDFYAIPSWDGLIIARYPDGWFLLHEDAEGPKSPWTEEVFVATAPRLAERA